MVEAGQRIKQKLSKVKWIGVSKAFGALFF